MVGLADRKREQIVEQKRGYCITTYKFRLYRKHPEWFAKTREMYCQTAEYYLSLIFAERLAGLSDFELQRRVEILTQGEKSKGIAPAAPLPFGKVPLYFRRAALREAAAAARSYETRRAAISSAGKTEIPSPVSLDTPPVYYKGMYRGLDLSEKRIELKLYTGKEWKWSSYRFSTDGREIPQDAVLLSPTIQSRNGQVFLHFPVKEAVGDVRTAKERAGEQYLSVSLQLGDTFAACVTEEPERIRMIRGGSRFRCRRLLLEQQLKQAQEEGKSAEAEKWKEKLRALIKEQAHKVSREIVSFAEETGCKVIAMPGYRSNPGFNRKPYLEASDYDWIGRRIMEYTAYKSFQRGILLCRVPAKGISAECSLCSAKIRRYNEGHAAGTGYLGGRLYECPNGHKGNTALNTARNIRNRYAKMEMDAR